MMQRLSRLSLMLGLTGLIAACGGGAEQAVKDFEALNNEACACTEKACADGAFTKLSGLIDKHATTRTSREADSETLAYWFKGAANCLIERGVSREQILALIARIE